MVSLVNQLTALFQSAMRQAYPALPADIAASVTPITKEQFGDYQFNSGEDRGGGASPDGRPSRVCASV